uniref:DNA polymerase epsilon catalytic subunit n=1 Tax=Glossina austeni TaxID=7395 RepID=A0A1A9UEW9_GLOAU
MGFLFKTKFGGGFHLHLIMSTNFGKDLHDVLSRFLREYPVLWRPWAASTKGQYKELTRRLTSELNQAVAISRVVNTLVTVRKSLYPSSVGRFEEGVLVGNIPIIDETILDVLDIICEGETETDETDAPRAPETMRRRSMLIEMQMTPTPMEITATLMADDDYDGPSMSAQVARPQLSNPRAKFDELSAHADPFRRVYLVRIENENDDNNGDDVEEVATRNEIDTLADEEEQLSLELNCAISESLPEENRCREKLHTNYGKGKPSPGLDLTRAIVKVLSVDKGLAEETNALRRNMLRLVGIGEFSDLAEWKDPYQSYTIAEVICQTCNHCRDVDLCKDTQRAMKGGTKNSCYIDIENLRQLQSSKSYQINNAGNTRCNDDDHVHIMWKIDYYGSPEKTRKCSTISRKTLIIICSTRQKALNIWTKIHDCTELGWKHVGCCHPSIG